LIFLSLFPISKCIESEEAEPAGVRPLLLWTSIMLDRSSATYEVHDDRDQGEDEQQVNEEAAHMQNKESAEPK
jgi:hypothetical protein